VAHPHGGARAARAQRPLRICLPNIGPAGQVEWRIWTMSKPETVLAKSRVEPTIRATEVIEWMRAASRRWPVPAPDDADLTRLVEALNILRVTREKSKEPAEAEGQARIARVAGAMDVLISELPGMIGRAERNITATRAAGRSPYFGESELCALVALLGAAEAARKFVRAWSLPHKAQPWHNVAHFLEWHFIRILSRLGHQDHGVGMNSPLASLITDALNAVDEGVHEAAAVGQALARARADRKRGLPLTMLEAAHLPGGFVA